MIPVLISRLGIRLALHSAVVRMGTLLVVVSIAAFVLPIVGERYRVPSVVLEIVFGILVGPSVANLVPGSELLSVLAGLGFFLLLFLAGSRSISRDCVAARTPR